MPLEEVCTNLWRVNPVVESWYLIRTKPNKERWVTDQLSGTLPEIFFTYLKTRVARFGRRSDALVPLFPGYVFARFDLRSDYYRVRYTPGVHGLVSAGHDPLAVPLAVIAEVKRRAPEGILELPAARFRRGEQVRVMEGPFQGFEAVFERYLGGGERVAILLQAVTNQAIRVVLPGDCLVSHG